MKMRLLPPERTITEVCESGGGGDGDGVVVMMPTDGCERASVACVSTWQGWQDLVPRRLSMLRLCSYEPSLWALGGERFPPCIGWFCGRNTYFFSGNSQNKRVEIAFFVEFNGKFVDTVATVTRVLRGWGGTHQFHFISGERA